MATRKAVVERFASGDIMVMFTDGEIKLAQNALDARRMLANRDRLDSAKLGIVITVIEWRGFQQAEIDALQPATKKD